MADETTPTPERPEEGGGTAPEQPPVAPPDAEEHAHEQQEGVVGETTPATEAGTPPADVVAEHDAAVADRQAAAPAEAAAPAPPEEAAAPAPPAQAAAPAPPADGDEDEEYEEEPAPRVKPAIPGADLEVDIVLEGQDALGRERSPYEEDLVEEEEPAPAVEEVDQPDDQPIVAVDINLTAEARYRATGKRKTSVARVTLRPGTGAYTINGRPLEVFFPRPTLQRNIRQPLETVGYEDRMDVIARMHGGGVSAQAGALRHGISRALLEADPNLRAELKRRGFLTRDARVKERKKAGLKKARKRPQFSKR
jgi:small subunit ribosomal protein S9